MVRLNFVAFALLASIQSIVAQNATTAPTPGTDEPTMVQMGSNSTTAEPTTAAGTDSNSTTAEPTTAAGTDDPTMEPTSGPTTAEPTLAPTAAAKGTTMACKALTGNVTDVFAGADLMEASCGPDVPCDDGLCCSQWGWCGNTTAHCGDCCQSDCRPARTPETAPVGPTPTAAPVDETDAPATDAPTMALTSTTNVTNSEGPTAGPTAAPANVTETPTSAPTAAAANTTGAPTMEMITDNNDTTATTPTPTNAPTDEPDTVDIISALSEELASAAPPHTSYVRLVTAVGSISVGMMLL